MSKPQKQLLFLPAGRATQGNVYKPNPLDMHGKPRAKPQYFVGIAVRKDNPELTDLLGAVYHLALAEFIRWDFIVNRIKMGLVKGTQFAWKITDGDLPNDKGKYDENIRGCWVFKFTSTHPFRVVNAQNQDIPPDSFRTGWWCDVAFTVAGNEKTDHTAGIHLNPVYFRYLWQDTEINPGPKADRVFQNRAAPQGAGQGSPTPSGGGMPGVGGQAPQQQHHAYHQPAAQYQQQPATGGMPMGAGNPTQAPGVLPAAQGQHPASGNAMSPGAMPTTYPSNQPAPGLSPMPMGNGQQAGMPSPHAHAQANQSSPEMIAAAPSHAATPGGHIGTREAMQAEVERLVAERLAMGNAGAGMTGGGEGAPASMTGVSDMGNGGHASGQAVPGGASAAPVAGSIDPALAYQTASPSNAQFQPHPQFVHGG